MSRPGRLHALQALARALCLCLLPFLSTAYAAQTGERWSNVDRVVVFADVHGAYDELTQLLRSVGVVDASLRWSGGATHVVSLGDLLDRGGGSRKVMDLLMRLQTEARDAGGVLHVVLGNHEAMNLLGDLRYVTPAEFAAYVADEPPDLRERARREWTAQHGAAATEFDERFPPGYFGHRAALAKDGKYGRWLLSQPVVIVVNDTLFMHGGPSSVLSGLSLEEINRRYRSALFANLPPPGEPDSSSRLDAAEHDPLLSSEGPNWYRGAALCNEVSESDVLKPLLEGLGAKRLVIGHTVARQQRAASRFDGTVIKLDAGMNRAAYKGHPAALLIERGEMRVAYADEAGSPAAVPHEPLYVSSPVIDEAAVASIVANGNVTPGATRAPGTLEVVVEQNGQRVRAVFTQAPADVVRRNVAAYQLDRALQLGLVPATVKRDVNGQVGFLQARPAQWASQAEVEQQSIKAGGWCAIPPQFELMYAFDALVGNEGRTRERILYDESNWMLMLTGHDQAFGTGKGLPRHLKDRPPQPGPEMRRRLATLDKASLERAVGDLLNDRERRALLARRDALLAGKAARAAAR